MIILYFCSIDKDNYLFHGIFFTTLKGETFHFYSILVNVYAITKSVLTFNSKGFSEDQLSLLRKDKGNQFYNFRIEFYLTNVRCNTDWNQVILNLLAANFGDTFITYHSLSKMTIEYWSVFMNKPFQLIPSDFLVQFLSYYLWTPYLLEPYIWKSPNILSTSCYSIYFLFLLELLKKFRP